MKHSRNLTENLNLAVLIASAVSTMSLCEPNRT